MTISLSHQDAYYNAKLLEKKRDLHEDEVFLFGTMGNRLVLVRTKNSLLSRIWHLLLQIFGFLDTSPRGTERLEDATNMHRSGAGYRKWALEKGKITPLERKKLLENQSGIKSGQEKKNEGLRLLSPFEQSLMERIESDKAKIAALEREVSSVKSSISQTTNTT